MNRVVVVDHSTTVRKMIKFVLEHHGFHIVEACDGTKALATLGQYGKDRVSLMFTDLDIPDLGGIELIRQVRNHPQHGRLPIILMANSAEVCSGQGRLAGASALLVKPLNIQRILETVQMVVGRAHN